MVGRHCHHSNHSTSFIIVFLRQDPNIYPKLASNTQSSCFCLPSDLYFPKYFKYIQIGNPQKKKKTQHSRYFFYHFLQVIKLLPPDITYSRTPISQIEKMRFIFRNFSFIMHVPFTILSCPETFVSFFFFFLEVGNEHRVSCLPLFLGRLPLEPFLQACFVLGFFKIGSHELFASGWL
jgi:hypothetical protein